MTKRAIILVPGYQKREQLEARDQLVESIDYYTDGYQISVGEGVTGSDGFNSVSVTAKSREDSSEVELQVYEAYWGDLIPDWENETPVSRFLRASRLLGYWVFGGLARSIIKRTLPSRSAVALALAGFGLFLWYVLVFTVLLQAFNSAGISAPEWLSNFFTWLGLNTDDMSKKLESVLTWAPILFLIGLFGVGRLESIASVADFLKTYLRDEPLGLNKIGIRAKTRKRVLALLDHVNNSDEPFDEVFIVAHSLGGAIAIDALAEYGKNLDNITLHTWGTALGVLVEQEPLVEAEICKLYESKTRLYNWIDVVFTRDVMASKAPIPHGVEAIFPATLIPKMPQGGSFRHQKLHDDYYRCENALVPLVAPAMGLLPVDEQES